MGRANETQLNIGAELSLRDTKAGWQGTYTGLHAGENTSVLQSGSLVTSGDVLDAHGQGTTANSQCQLVVLAKLAAGTAVHWSTTSSVMRSQNDASPLLETGGKATKGKGGG